MVKWRLVRLRRTCSSGAFSRLELVVAALVIVVLIIVAMPMYLNSVADGELKTCRGNLQTISNCVESARLKSGAIDYTELIAGGVTKANLPLLVGVPVCPSGGVYTLAMGSSGDAKTFKVQCSFDAHGKFEPGIDSN